MLDFIPANAPWIPAELCLGQVDLETGSEVQQGMSLEGGFMETQMELGIGMDDEVGMMGVGTMGMMEMMAMMAMQTGDGDGETSPS